jgi:hypothetical protein
LCWTLICLRIILCWTTNDARIVISGGNAMVVEVDCQGHQLTKYKQYSCCHRLELGFMH